MKRSTFLATMVAAGLFAFAAHAESMKQFHAMLNGASEVPPTNSKGTGELNASLDDATKTLNWTLTYSGLKDVAAAHFHGPAEPGKNAGVAVPIKDHASGAKGSAKLTDAQIADLEAGKWYVNVHTKEHPQGEIRGQVMPGGGM